MGRIEGRGALGVLSFGRAAAGSSRGFGNERTH